MVRPRTVRTRTLKKTPYVRLYRAEVDFGRSRKTYYVSEYGRRTGLLLLRGEAVLLVRQYRFVAGGSTWEIPGGRIDDGESAAEAAARECREETGWHAEDVRPLVSYIPGTDIIDNPTEVCVGRAAKRERRTGNPETVGSRWVSLRKCLEWIRSGRINCGMTILALCAFVALQPGALRSGRRNA